MPKCKSHNCTEIGAFHIQIEGFAGTLIRGYLCQIHAERVRDMIEFKEKVIATT